MINRCSKPKLYLSAVLIMAITACTHLSPRMDQNGLPVREYFYQRPVKAADGWETACIDNANIDRNTITEMMNDILAGNDRNIHSLLIV